MDPNLDFMCFSERWLKGSRKHCYDLFSRDRSEGRGGGLLIYAEDHLKCDLMHCKQPNDLQCMWLDLNISPTNVHC